MSRWVPYNKRNKQKEMTRVKIWRAGNPEKTARFKKISALKRQYGLSIEQFEAMLAAQGSVCKICGKPETLVNRRSGKVQSLAVDHDKHTKKVRGLLCSQCNQGIGYLYHDVKIFESAVIYLRESQ